ncbi:PQQ-binding-like beta-propeller repeat protein [Streptomyces coelicoflavus]|uniref:PQQ-binding-like beta-propeller repeat protein n=1 Tax=Streptomyces coelicoflavus TaxID=285562 RepID=A0A7K3PRV1_9ACTN|nr:PQQ-binding-like beta-propeller repeat protein [Streptomyces coelicoflavus]NEB12694.1 PQQ-binding-like beta-propeller repeat protein [Streptomyces coelicoflavus]
MKHGMAARGAVAVAALALCGCGSSGGERAKDTGSGGKADAGPAAPPAEEIRAVKAPKRFSTDRAVVLPASAGAGNVAIAGVQHPLPIALHKGVAYIARPDGLEIASGYVPSDPVLITPRREPLARLDDLGPMVGGNTAREPLVTEHGGTTLVLSALVGRVPGSGTAKGHDALELMATDTAQGTKAWSVEIPLAEGHYSVREGQSEVVGRSGGTVVVMGHGQLFGVDLGSRRTVWSAPGDFQEGAVLAGGTVVGLRLDEDGTDRRVVGLDPATGRQRWSEPRLAAERLYAAGPETVVASGYVTDDSDDGALLLDAASGDRVRQFPEDAATDGECAYDGVSTTVCTYFDQVSAYDAATGEQLWALPDEAGTRTAPEVTLVREGLVYGTTENGPVVVAAATGEDVETRPGIAPYVSDGYVGIALAEEDHAVTAYRTRD